MSTRKTVVVVAECAWGTRGSKKALEAFFTDHSTSFIKRFLEGFRIRKTVERAVSALPVEDITRQRDALQRLTQGVEQMLTDAGESAYVYACTPETVKEVARKLAKRHDVTPRTTTVLIMRPMASDSVDRRLNKAVQTLLSKARLKGAAVISDYGRKRIFVKALAALMRSRGFDEDRGDRLVLSYPSISINAVEKGDDYELACGGISVEIASELDFQRRSWTVAYSQRLSYDTPQLEPATRTVLSRWGSSGKGNVFILRPSAPFELSPERIAFDQHDFDAWDKAVSELPQHANCNLTIVPALGATKAHARVISELLLDHWRSDND